MAFSDRVYAYIMKKHHLITTAMAGLTVLTGGMLSSCSDEEVASAEQAKANYYTAQAVNADTAAARAKVFPALAWLPKGTNTYLAGNVTEFVSVANKISGSEPIEIPFEMQSIDTFAIGITDGTEKAFSHLRELYTELYAAISRGEQKPDMDKIIKSLADAVGQIKPIYVVVTCHTEDEAKALAAQLNFLIALSLKDAPFLKTSLQGGWNLVTCKPADIPTELAGANLSGCGDLAVSLGITSRGNAMVAALTVNPQELQVPATVAESVLGTNAADALDDAVNGKGLAAASISPNLANTLRDYYMSFTEAGIMGYKQASTLIGSSSTEEIEQCTAAFKMLAEFVNKLIPYTTRPGALTIWQDGDLHLCLQGDSNGLEFSTAQLNTTVPQDAVVYAYGSGVTAMNCPSMEEIDRAAQAVFTLTSITKSERTAAELKEIYNVVKSLLPHFTALNNSMGKGWVAHADISATETRSLGDPQNKTAELPAPCIRMAAQLDNRAAFGKAMADINSEILAFAEKKDPRAAQEIKEVVAGISHAQNGAYTTYTHPHTTRPEEGLCAGVAISDSMVGMGSDLGKVIQLCDSATGNTAVSGIVVNVNLAPVEPYLVTELEWIKESLETLRNAPDSTEYLIDWHEEWVQEQQEQIDDFREILQRCTGGTLSITSEKGCSKTHIKVYTPALK